MDRLEITIKTVRKIGYYLMQFWGNVLSVDEKTSFYDLVTEHDKKAQDMMIKAIKDRYESDSIIAEEGINEYGKRLWIIDPIDGTINFIHGLPFFAISVAYLENEEPLFGVVHLPVFSETFIAIKNEGAYLNNIKLKILPKKSLSQTVGSSGYSPEFTGRLISKFENKVRRIRILGSAAISASYVGAGKFDFFIARKTNPWDIAAATLIVKEAGGEVVNFDGETPNILERGDFVFTNPGILDDVLKIVKNL
ncbi:inositol monophosphatase [Thermosipho ferrireducens]|uniref:Inositol monophosphatase n=1 Tax=Thermosipho ferrireducens TaxID=2571116 RepID=A0ABX7S6K5_9BACT|nr:inositol monophosphatase [Thermosipho ferrireducens]QTA38217.1 inositol monophosphatase [Thermosipho ferrireducens]